MDTTYAYSYVRLLAGLPRQTHHPCCLAFHLDHPRKFLHDKPTRPTMARSNCSRESREDSDRKAAKRPLGKDDHYREKTKVSLFENSGRSADSDYPKNGIKMNPKNSFLSDRTATPSFQDDDSGSLADQILQLTEGETIAFGTAQDFDTLDTPPSQVRPGAIAVAGPGRNPYRNGDESEVDGSHGDELNVSPGGTVTIAPVSIRDIMAEVRELMRIDQLGSDVASRETNLRTANHDEEPRSTSAAPSSPGSFERSPVSVATIAHAVPVMAINVVKDSADIEGKESVKKSKQQKKRSRYLLLAACAAMLVGVGVVVWFVKGKGGDDSANEDETAHILALRDFIGSHISQVLTSSPSDNRWANFSTESYFNDTEAGLAESERDWSPQYRALMWLLNEVSPPKGSEAENAAFVPPVWFSNFSDLELLQRFAAATFFYSTGGDYMWTRKDHWLSHDQHLCDWYTTATPGDGFVLTNVSLCTNESVKEDVAFGGVTNDAFAKADNSSLRNGNLRSRRMQSSNDSPVVRTQRLLVKLELASNNLQGSVPTEAIALFSGSMRILRLTGNSLEGPVPRSLTLLTNLEALALSANAFTGPVVPTSLGILSRLKEFQNNGELLTGSIPDTIASWTDLQLWDVGGVTGTIPTVIGMVRRPHGS
jgi:hypothetical protein